jgi:hypothetical protein
MKINYHHNNGDFVRDKKQSGQVSGDFSFADALNRACNNKPTDFNSEFLTGLSANFAARISYYENTATTEEHSAYVEMMKFYAKEKENKS